MLIKKLYKKLSSDKIFVLKCFVVIKESYLVIKAKEVTLVKEVIRSDGLSSPGTKRATGDPLVSN